METAEAFAVALYCLPVVVLWASRSRRDRALWEIALDVPLAVGLDLVVVLALAQFVIVAYAVVVARLAWGAYAAGHILLRRRRGDAVRWPQSIDSKAAGAVLGAVAAATWLSLSFSRQFTIWDREWHIPLSASLGGQKGPFFNVYQPDTVLHYHFTGDVLAAELQVLSGCRLNASLALSLAHDVMFGFIGLAFALLLRAFGARGVLAAIGATIALLLSGPFTLWSDQHGFRGYSFLSYLQMSFRPHVSLAGLLILGFVGALAVGSRADEAQIPRGRALFPLLASGIVLSFTDEASFALLGLASGIVWLLRPQALHTRRLRGLAWLLATAFGAAVANLLFKTSLVPGGPIQHVTFVPWTLPGYSDTVLRLSDTHAQRILFYDILPTVCALVATVWATGRRTVSAPAGTILFCLVLTFAGLAGLTSIAIEDAPWEAHRFATAPTFTVPILSMLILASAPPAAPSLILMQLGLVAGAISSIVWGLVELPKAEETDARYGPYPLYTTDCRTLTHARVFERASAYYIEQPLRFLWGGCHPSFLPGAGSPEWQLKTSGPETGIVALRELGEWVGAAPVTAVCGGQIGNADPVCQFAFANNLCTPSGTAAFQCRLGQGERRRLLAAP